MSSGYFEIGIVGGKTPVNLGTLWRSAYQLGAMGIFTVGRRYPQQASDTVKACRHIPLREYPSLQALLDARPYDCRIVGVEMGGTPLARFNHPKRCIYLLGAEDGGLSQTTLASCQMVASIEAVRTESYNVAVAGSLVMYARWLQYGLTNKAAKAA